MPHKPLPILQGSGSGETGATVLHRRQHLRVKEVSHESATNTATRELWADP